jgi:predicted anti-sigma-YlaC factor YlaD
MRCDEIWEILVERYGEGREITEEVEEHLEDCEKCRLEFKNMQIMGLQ